MASETKNAKTGLYTQDYVSRMYDPWRASEGESLLDYYARLKEGRKGGILGTAGLLDVAKDASPDSDLGEVKKNAPQCAPGYVWNGSACVPASGDDSESKQLTPEQQKNIALNHLTGRSLTPEKMFGPGLLGMALGKLRGYSDDQYMMNSLKGAGMSEAEARDVIEKDPEKIAMMAECGMLDFGLERPYNFAEANSVNSWLDVGKNVGRDLGNRLGGLFGNGNYGNETFGYQAVVPNLGISSLEGSLGMMSSGSDYDMRVADMERIRDSFDKDTGKYNFDPNDWTSDYGSGPSGDTPTVGGGWSNANVSDTGSRDDAYDNSGYAG